MNTKLAALAILAIGAIALASVTVAGPSTKKKLQRKTPSSKIAFLRTATPSWDSHIFVMNPDGTNLHQVTYGSDSDRDQMWSPDGSRIVFDRWVTPSTPNTWPSDIFVVKADGTGLKRLTDTGSSWGPAWSPDGRRIAYGSGTRLFLMNADGARKRQLAYVNRRHAWAGEPRWSPDGKRIAFGTGDGVAFVVNADGTGKRRLTRPDYGWGPVWSPRGDRLALLGGLPRYSSIYVVNALRPGARPRRVTRHAYTESGFAWSPNGRRIVYARENRGGVYVIKADGTHDRRLTRDPLRADLLAGGFSWSPDRSDLVYASDRSGNGDIYVMNFLSNDAQQLTEGLAIDGTPRWSPSPHA